MSENQQIATISATLNGERRELEPGVTILTLLETLGIKPDRVAVEFNRKIIKPAEWSVTTIGDGSEIEIVHFVGGG